MSVNGLWLGCSPRRAGVNPYTYAEDPTFLDSSMCPLRSGHRGAPARGPGLRGVVDGIGAQRMILGARVYNWVYPGSLPLTIDRCAIGPEVRLVFLAWATPILPFRDARRVEARALSDHLGLTGTHVFFKEDGSLDSRAECCSRRRRGYTIYHIETRFFIPDPILDYLWAGLPWC